MKSEALKKPPFTNRGVERTREMCENLGIIEENRGFSENSKKLPFLEESYILIDWIQATIIKDDISVYELFRNLFGLESYKVVKEASGFFGYDTSYSYKGIKIMTAEYRRLEGLGDMGYHIYITGSGCRDIEDLNVDYRELFQKLLNYGAKFTRLDISVDDFSKKYFTIPKIQKCIKSGNVVTRFRNSIEFIKTKLEDGANNGCTIWFGSRASDIQIVFYDKLKERESQDYIVSEGITFWIRLECRLRNHNASEMAEKFADLDFEEFKKIYVGVISNYIRFVVPNAKDKNKRRWKTQTWWEDFIGNVSRISLQKLNVENTILKKRNWILSSVSRNNLIVMLSEMEYLTIDNIFGHYLCELLTSGVTKVKDRDLQYMNDLRIKKGLVTIQKEEVYDFIQDIREEVKERDELFNER